MTYQDDPSFFIFVHIPFADMNYLPILNWFETTHQAKFRLIKDDEVHDQQMNLQTLEGLYPGVKTFSIVMNPWALCVLAYRTLWTKEQSQPGVYTSDVDISSFDNFIKGMTQLDTNGLWYSGVPNQIDWITYQLPDGSTKEVDYILRQETLAEDFVAIQNFFEAEPLAQVHPVPDYKDRYTEETKAIVAQVFARDIARFGYTF